MVNRVFLKAALCFALAVQLFAADVAGKWTAETKGRDGNPLTYTYDFKVDGEKLTGTLSSRMGERQILDGKVNGDEVSFKVTFERDGNTMTFLYKGKVAGDELKINMSSESGEFSRDVVAKRVK
jgi:hypothetical protein